jgi:hypothetical protein
MSKRFVVVGSATAVAGLVLGATIVFGPPAAQPKGPNPTGNIAPPSIGAPGNPDQAGVKIYAFDYTTFEADADGQLRGMRLRADETNLKPQGITELIRPHAEIRLGTQRAITITADKADMEMEDKKPRRGRFSGNVIVTISEAPAGIELILEQPDYGEDREADEEEQERGNAYEQFVQQRIYMDEATDFSIEDDTISTEGPVHVTSAQVDFFGIGLRLAYNTQRERIEQLVITEGRYLIINPEANAPGFNTVSETDIDDEPEGEAAGPDTQQPLAPKQFYAATFQGDVLVRDGLESELAGQTLTIDFSLGTDTVEVQPIDPDAVGQLPYLIPLGQLAQANNTGPSLPALVIPAKNQARTLLDYKPERDIVVTWTGQLSVKPHAKRPERLTNDDDAHLTLAGPNAYAQTIKNGDRERLETNKLEYLVSEERTTAYASDERAMRILSTALGGEITGTKLVVRQQAGTATILGPGELTYTDKKDGKTLKLTWQNRLDLELYTQQTNADAEQSEASDTTQILGVKTATFDGDVTAKHTDFDLTAQTLTLAFAKPDKASGIDNHPTAINASGAIAVQARGDAEDETFDITAGRLSIDLKLDDNQEPYAAAIRAIDDVNVNRPGSKLTCNRVSVELDPPDAEQDEASGKEDKDERFAQVRSILAVGNVRADLLDEDGKRIDLIADQLIADVENDKLTLAADAVDNPAEVTDLTSGRKLTGMLIEMDDQAKQLDITGKGSLATVLEDPNNPDAGIEDAFLAIDWTKSMSFNNATGLANFQGNVRSESRRSIDASELKCDTLTMVFSPELANDGKKQKDDEELTRQIRSAVAIGNVRFLASAWEVDEPNKISNRVLLEGPKLVITNQPAADGKPAKETLLVDGKGRMTFEDYRPPDEKNADDDAKLTGRGATLFTWDETMTLDALASTATLVGTVQMVHLPKDEDGKKAGDTVQLDCQTLVADMTDTGGMSVWLSDTAPDATIQSITATDNVRLLQQETRSIRCDTLIFDGEKNNVAFNANPGRDVIIEDLQRDNAARTNKATWDLTNDRIEIDKLRGGVAPLN